MAEEFINQREQEAISKQYIDDEYWYEHFNIIDNAEKRTTEGQ